MESKKCTGKCETCKNNGPEACINTHSDSYVKFKWAEKEWNEFWKEIVCNKDGSINIEKLKKELSDFSFILEQVPQVYSFVTNGLLSDLNYTAKTVISSVIEQQKNLIDKEMAKDDLLIILDGEIGPESKRKIIDYFSE